MLKTRSPSAKPSAGVQSLASARNPSSATLSVSDEIGLAGIGEIDRPLEHRRILDAAHLATLDMAADGAERQIGGRLLRQHMLQPDEHQPGRDGRLDHAGKGAVVLDAELQPPIHENVVLGPRPGLRRHAGQARPDRPPASHRRCRDAAAADRGCRCRAGPPPIGRSPGRENCLRACSATLGRLSRIQAIQDEVMRSHR